MIALGLDYKKIFLKLKKIHFQKSILTQESFSSNLMAASTDLHGA